VAVLYRLVADADDPARARALADVEETARGIGTSVGGGYLRSFRLRPAAGEPVDLFLTLTVLGEGDALVESFRTMGTTPSTEVGWVVVRRAAGGFEAIGVTLPTGSEPRRSHGAFEAPLRIVPGVEADVTVSTFLPTEWNDETGLRLANEVRR